MKHKIKWDDLARDQLREAFNYIRRDSLANAEKVRKEIIAAARSAELHPKRFPADKDKIDNDGNYRAFVMHRYRVSYKIHGSEITVLRLRHTSMEPLEY